MKLKTSTYLALLFLNAFLIRLTLVLSLVDISQGPVDSPSSDDVQFNNLARQLAEGNGYRMKPEARPTSFRAPGYPIFLAGLYALFRENAPLVYVCHCLLGALACVMTYALGREVLSEGGARWAGVLAALYLPHAYIAAVFISENLFVPLFALGVWLATRWVACFRRPQPSGTSDWQQGPPKAWHPRNLTLVLAGLVFGYATLTRPFTLLMLPITVVVVGWAWLRGRWVGTPTLTQQNTRQDWNLNPLSLWPLAAFAFAFLAVLAPWTYRNYLVHDRFVLVATNGGSTFWGSNNDRVVSEPKLLGYWVPTNQLPHRDQIDAAPDEVTHDQIEWRLGKEWIRDNLSKMPLLEVLKFLRLWWLPEYGPGLRWLRIVSYVPYLLLFLLGAWRCLRSKQYWTLSWGLIHGGMLALFATVLIFSGQPRFRDANMPLLMLYAALGIRPFVKEDGGSK